VGGQHHAPAVILPGKTRYPLYRRLGGPQGRSGRVRKISPPPGFDPRTVQHVASRYTDWANQAHTQTYWVVEIWPGTPMTFRRYQNRWRTASIDVLFSCFQHEDDLGDRPLHGTESSSKYQPNVLSYTVTSRVQSKILLEKLTVTQLLKKLPRLLWNPHVHYRHSNSRMAHTLTFRLRRSVLMLSIHQGLGFPGGIFPFSIMKENYICISYIFLNVCYMPAPTHPSFFDHPSNIQSRVPITKLLIM